MFVVVLNFETSEQSLFPESFIKKPSVHKFCDLMLCKSKKQCLKTAKFNNCILKEFRE